MSGESHKKNPGSTDALTERLKGLLGPLDDVELAFLFGSAAVDRECPRNDVDLAILFRERPDYDRLAELRDDIAGGIGEAVDIVVLNGASPVVRMQVLRKGRRLVAREGGSYADFFARTVLDYDDLKRVRREVEDKILRGRIYA